MQTWKDVFRRREELQNLKNIGFCILIIVALITGSYALTTLRDIFQVSREVPAEWEMTATPDEIEE